MTRKAASFIDAFMRYTEGRGSPALYRKWTAIFLISAVLERKAWITTAKGRWFPNQFVNLVGPAGVGKSLCTSTAYALLCDIRSPENPLHIAPTSVTKASLVDRLGEAERRIVKYDAVPPVVSFNSLIIISSELGVFLPSWESDFMSTLTDLWDNGRYEETRRTNKTHLNIPNAQLNLLSATTPAYLNTLLPEGAWEFGFMSRVMNVYSGEIEHTDIFAELDHDGAAYKGLVHDLADVYKIYGEYSIEDDVKIAVNDWASSGGRPSPDHPKLAHYRTRRLAHLLKLVIVAAAARDNDRIITLEDYTEALDWLLEVEHWMPDIFKSMNTGGDARAMEECWHYAYTWWMKHQEAIPEHMLVTFLSERVPAHNVVRILDIMERTQLLTKQFLKSGGSGYKPKPKIAA